MINEILEKIANIKPNEEHIYYVGQLSRDIEYSGYGTDLNKSLKKIREAAWSQYTRGKAILYQKKDETASNPSVYYYMIKGAVDCVPVYELGKKWIESDE